VPSDQVVELLGNAEEIVNSIASDALAEARAEDAKREGRSKKWWKRRL
jgi:hypothetical protein